ncbi:MAG: SAM-dependent DNA methyltransferase [Caldilineaceae bacterium SB0662_bin_9]|uniref:site-specific DNA-methyltransferase (adenine-specific) n=1 Tax=Caldilineaceae bacterium SB0662_bin_9 TaxID=2605258 RepID=A0A6B1DVH3_9CHLR|nr:SAM-dependent DNA methyltransferase [Caldilineaceae bacterium SB0662_bin_9]
MATSIIINALAYQQILDGHQGIQGLARIRESTAGGQLTKDAVIAGFDAVLDVNFWPIFHMAKEILLLIPSGTAHHMLESMAATADGIFPAMQHNDVAGTLFQKLIADRKTLKAYYTSPAATTLMAHLSIPEDLDWANPEILKAYRIADYACGSGGLMFAGYQRVRDLHRLNGGNPDTLHSHLMQECLTACDIMPAAVHLTASLLSSTVPNKPYEGTRCILFPFGGEHKINRNGQRVTDREGNPVKATTGRGKPIVHVGSIALLGGLAGGMAQAVLPPEEQAALGAHGEGKGVYVPMPPFSQSLVIMNPPFTTPTKHAPRGRGGHVDPKNPAFAAFGTTDEEQKEMKKLERKLGKHSISDGNAGLGTTFTAIAHRMVQPGGHIALILPTAAMMAGSYDAQKDQAYSWQRLRNLLDEEYGQIVVVSVAHPDKKYSAFSADSNFADCMVIARRLSKGKKPDRRVHFVNLREVPATKLAAQETARAIRAAVADTPKQDTWSHVRLGDEVVGFVRCDGTRRNHRWTSIRISDATLLERARKLFCGKLYLPRRGHANHLSIPLTVVGSLVTVGPLSRDLTERKTSPFRKRSGHRATDEYPMLSVHATSKQHKDIQKTQTCMLTKPDSACEVTGNRHEVAAQMWGRFAAHLHFNQNFQFNANATAAVFTPELSLGGRTWPTLSAGSRDHEKALCVWFNSTLGMLVYWLESYRTQNGRGSLSVTAIPNLPALDVAKLDEGAMASAVQIFDTLKEKRLLPANEAWRDPVRQELDRLLLTEVLGFDDQAPDDLAVLRRQWCSEPTVSAIKQTGPSD